MSVLSELLRPFSVRRYLSHHREKSTLFVRGEAAGKFHKLLSLETMDHIVASGFLRFPECKLAKQGRDVPPNRYIIGDASFGAIDIDALYSEYSKGATIIVNSAQRYWRPLSNLCRELERLLSVPVQSNIYLTPKGSQGFTAHYDPHDVFILQIAGKKHWRLYGSPIILPDEKQLFNSSMISVGRIRRRCTLRAGDLLYIPRGHIHDATATQDASLHITVGMRGITWGNLLQEAVTMLTRSDPTLRTSLPAGFAGRTSVPKSVQRQLLRLRSKVSSDLPLAGALDEIADRFVSQRYQSLEGQLMDLESGDEIRLESIVERRPEILFRLWREKNKTCLLFFRKKMLFPAFAGPALKYIGAAASFRPLDIPGRLSNESKLVLCRSLVDEGFLKVSAE